MELRKLYADFNKKERNLIKGYLNKLNNYKFTNHCKDRQKTKIIDTRDIINAVKCGEIIEYHYKNGSNRVLIRGNKIIDNANINVVLDIKTGEVVTVWYNNIDDRHSTLDYNIYSRDINIVSIIKAV